MNSINKIGRKMIFNIKIIVSYVGLLVGFPIFALSSYNLGLFYSDYIGLIWFIIFFDILFGTFLLIHIDYMMQQKSNILVSNISDPAETEEVYLTY